MSAVLARRLRRFLRRVSRYPRLVSHEQYMALTRSLPAEQRKNAVLVRRMAVLGEAMGRLGALHLVACKEKQEVKALLALADPEALDEWKDQKAKEAANKA